MIFVIIALAVSCFISGCSNSNKSVSDLSKKKYFGVVVGTFDDTWRTLVRNQLYDMAEKQKIKIDIWSGKGSQKSENEKIDELIKRKSDVLAINLVDVSAAPQIIDKAKKANIPVIFFNIEPARQALKKWNKAYYVGAIGKKSGILQGQMLADYFKKNPTKDGAVHYAMLKGMEQHPDTISRTKYSVDAMKDMGLKVEKVDEITASWDREIAHQEMEKLLKKANQRIDCVIANNDDMALGAIDGLKENGYFKGRYIPVVGVDATNSAVNAIKKGTLLGTVLNDAKKQAKAIFKVAEIVADKKTPNFSNCGYKITGGKYIWIGYKKITKENIGDVQ
jgi:methyl-galactoside transport system substrate-binding protein